MRRPAGGMSGGSRDRRPRGWDELPDGPSSRLTAVSTNSSAVWKRPAATASEMRRSSSGLRSTDIANLESIVRNPYLPAVWFSSANPLSHIISKDSMALTKFRLALAGIILLLANTACNRNSKLRIAVIPKGQTHIFWQSVHAGAAKAGQELGVEILWNGPAAENDLSGQI